MASFDGSIEQAGLEVSILLVVSKRKVKNKMIAVDLFGGMGNQMFQYALGRHLAIKNESSLTLFHVDVGFSSQRPYALGCFKLASKAQIKLDAKNKKAKIWRKLRNLLGVEESVVREDSFHFDPKILDLRGNIHLHGYWQSEKYFKDIRPTILEDFTFVRPLNNRNQRIFDEIKKTNSVSVHVRRGDYVINQQTNKFHGICGPDYYKKAVDIIAKRVGNPVFYFFSDDIGWVKKNLKTNYKNVYVDLNIGEQSFVDMQLMSNCRHNILANSSFSWWGAWLNFNPGKIVVAPKKWFQDPSMDTKDLIPSGWIKV